MKTGQYDLQFGLSGKKAIVTGAASGIGYAIAQGFAQKGASLCLVDRASNITDVAKEIADTYKVNAVGLALDLTAKASATTVVEHCVNQLGGLDILVNNAGLSFLDKAEDLAEEKWDKTMALNLKAPFLLSQAAAKVMIPGGGGCIINMASQAGIIALDEHVAYCASKAGVISLTQVCALEWGKHNINVNCLSPTVILTDMGLSYWVGQRGDDMKNQIPIGRFGYPQDVAAACVFLASDEASLMSGSNLVLDGGYTCK